LPQIEAFLRDWGAGEIIGREDAIPSTKENKYRRSAPLVLYWQGGQLVFENFALGTRISADPLVCSILNECSEWRSVREIESYLGEYEESSVRRTLEKLCKNGVLERSDRKRDARVVAMESWAAWNPAAGFFHFSTKDAEFAADQRGPFEELKRRARHDPMPRPLKSYSKAQRIKLPGVSAAGEFAAVLKSRRTWRKYGPGSVSVEALAQALRFTFGIQGWVDVPGLGRAAIKTSPSGGGLHPIEAYVLVQHVNGLKSGIYHYDAARHELEWLRTGISRCALEKSLGGQWWFTRGAFLVLMTAVFGRTQWKYDFARSYRVVLAESGHLCQTFCLTATWLGLAPFCSMALADTMWEEWLGIDGVRESIIYLVGAGTRPKEGTSASNILTLQNARATSEAIKPVRVKRDSSVRGPRSE
jgi:SagB-type dehydrogenase family enzyme